MRLLGEILQEISELAQEHLDHGLEIQKEKGGRIGEILLHQKYIQESDLAKALSMQLDLEFLPTLPTDIDTNFTERLPIQFLKKFKMIPMAGEDGNAVVVNDPFMYQAQDELCQLLEWDNAKTVVAPLSAILNTINFSYDISRDSAEEVIQDLHDDPDSIISEIEETGDLLDDTSDAPVIKLVNLMFSQAIRAGASDIHIEPFKNRVAVRQRIDGILYDMFTPPSHIQAALVSRIKVMAKLNIAEKRLPQDGRTGIRIADKNVDVRVSTLPTSFGERVVLRLLDKSSVLLKLTDLGMTPERLNLFDNLIHAAHGILLVTGPTGSGKTTTLYAALSTINNTDINIITIEDPVEYQMEGIGQVQVNPKINLTFANGLRSIVRQDPDVILVGEIRDMETAEIAIQAALTGHLVFSTLHTNDSSSAVTRLIDMGIEPFLVTSSVNAILAQRLIRRLCKECRKPFEPDEESLNSIGITQDMLAGRTLYRNKGCSSCQQTGYKGREGIFELMVVDDEIQSLILKTSDANAIKKLAVEHGMLTLRRDGARKVLEGITTIEEVFRVTEQ
ncbi:MAG: type II secretion system ATPase GspE [Desulfuromonadales bacterium]|nr:type II secretion system ATPase GspE [Desulfuromonadales bacterium]